MEASPQPGRLVPDPAPGSKRLVVEGDWTLAHYHCLLDATERAAAQAGAPDLDLSKLGALDTAGASLLARLVGPDRLPDFFDRAAGLDDARRALLNTVGQATLAAQGASRPREDSTLVILLGRLGCAAVECWKLALGLFGFLGLTLESMWRSLWRPSSWRVTATVAQIEQTGLDAVPIVALLTFLVGAVVAFLGATVLANFGASIFTINLVGFAFLREFAVLLTAIMLAGRTASAYTAQIGSMKANEEIDAIRALGLDPINMLVLPRVLALLVSLPALTFMSMITGILGGMAVCALSLDIPPVLFLSTLRDSVGISHFVIGMVKAPIFALVIGVIGCLEGFKVDGSAQSVGEHTTSSVVQSIFLVILLDALAAMLCTEMGW